MVHTLDQVLLSCELGFTPTSFHIHAPDLKTAKKFRASFASVAMYALKLEKREARVFFPGCERPYEIPAKMALNAMLSTTPSSEPKKIQEAAQQELETYLADQAHAIAPAKVDRVDVTASYTYLSIIDEDLPAQTTTRLMVQLEDCDGNERLVDLITNNDRAPFVTRLINNNFDPCWKIADCWTPAEPF